MKPANYRKVLVEVFLVILFAVTALAQPGGQMSQQQRELADYIKQNYTKSEVMIPMRDGVKLFV